MVKIVNQKKHSGYNSRLIHLDIKKWNLNLHVFLIDVFSVVTITQVGVWIYFWNDK